MNPWRVPLRIPALLALLAPLAGCGKDPTGATAPPPPTYDYYVDAATGLDGNPGTAASPFKTISHAVAAAGTGKSIAIAPGNYGTANGDNLPIVLRAGQTLVGDVANRGNGPTPTRIRGDGPTPGVTGYSSTFVGADGASLRGLLIGSANTLFHYALYVGDAAVTVADCTFDTLTYGGVYLRGTGASLFSNDVFNTNSYGVHLIDAPDTTIIEHCQFNTPSLPIDVAATSITRAIVRSNRIVGSGQVGIQVQSGEVWIEDNVFDKPGGYATNGAVRCQNAEATPIVRRNSFTCARGIGIVNGLPDLGSAGSPGSNLFTGVTGAAVYHGGGGAITAIGNTWQHTPPTEGADIVLAGMGSVRWGTGPSDIYP
jgi:hypothetical protein